VKTCQPQFANQILTAENNFISDYKNDLLKNDEETKRKHNHALTI
jgi:hypothetical protein